MAEEFDPVPRAARPPRLPAPEGDGPRGAEPVKNGVMASAALHGAVIGLAVFGVNLFGTPELKPMVFENVTMVDGQAFQAAASAPPDVSSLEAAALASPMSVLDTDPSATSEVSEVVQTEEYVYGDVNDQEAFPDLTAVLTPLQRAKVKPPKVAALAPANPTLGAAGPGLAPLALGGASPGLRAPGLPGGSAPGPMRQGRSLSIDTSADEAPPPPAKEREADQAHPETDAVARAEEAKKAASADGAVGEAQEKEQREEAPEAASDRALTEADRTDPEAKEPDGLAGLPEAPQIARVPQGRPTDLLAARAAEEKAEAERLAALKEAEEKAAEEARAAEAKAEAEKKKAEALAAAKAAEEKAAEEKAAAEAAAAKKEQERLAAEKKAKEEADRLAEAKKKKEAEEKLAAAEKKKKEEEAAKAAAAEKAAKEKAAQAAAAAAKEQAEKTASAAGTTPGGQGQAPAGPPLSEGVKGGLRSAIGKRWNTSFLERLPNYRSLVVTMRITLDRSGRIVGEPELVSPSSSAGAVGIAVKAAATALLKAQPYDLPAESYGRWQVIEVTFNPGSGVSM